MRFRWLLLLPLLMSRSVLVAGEQPPWQVFELDLKSEQALPNAYIDGLPEDASPLVRATFKSGDLQFTIAGFWDGGKTWRVRFAPPAPGEWSYETVSSDASLNGVRGRFACDAATEAEMQANPRSRAYSSRGERPLLPVCRWHAVPVDRRHVVELEQARHPLADFPEAGRRPGCQGLHGGTTLPGRQWRSLGSQLDHPDLEHLRRVEEFVAYANSKGITVWIHPWWSRKDLDKTVGAEKLRRWWRYTIHRFGAYNVIWVLAGEYNMHDYGGLGLDFWKELGTLVRREDPYRRLIGAHPTPPAWEGGAAAPQWSTGEVIHAEPWLDYNQSQVGHGKWRNEMIPRVIAADYARTPAKPTIVTEPWYEFIEGNPPAEDVRFAAWSAVLSGAAGHTYGGGHVWRARAGSSHSTRYLATPGRFRLGYARLSGHVSIGFLARFLRASRGGPSNRIRSCLRTRRNLSARRIRPAVRDPCVGAVPCAWNCALVGVGQFPLHLV